MGSKRKKVAKQLAKATSDVLPKKKRKKFADLIERSANKLAKKLYKKKKPEATYQIKKVEELDKEPEVWKPEVSEEPAVKADK